MGLLKAGAGALGGVLADQWRDYFYCDALDAGVLAAKGKKRTSRRSSNTKADENIISNGSILAVNEGQCMLIVEQGKIVEVCAEAGEFLYDSGTEPSVFYGGLGKGLLNSFATLGKRFGFGGDTAMDQRVYYFNTKEIVGNKYGTTNPIPFRVVDRNIGLDVDIAIRCNGEFSYRIADPLLFYKNVCGNVADVYRRSEIDSMLRTELLTAAAARLCRHFRAGCAIQRPAWTCRGDCRPFESGFVSKMEKPPGAHRLLLWHQLRKRLPGGRSHDQRAATHRRHAGPHHGRCHPGWRPGRGHEVRRQK